MKSNEDGFTIIELMIATAVFTVILIITSTTIIGISQTYIKGTVQDQTQQTARSIMSDISQDIQFNNNDYISQQPIASSKGTDVFFFCIGDDVYVYRLDKVLSNTPGTEYSSWGLVRYQSLSCPSAATVPHTLIGLQNKEPGFEELLTPNERLGQLNIQSDNNYAAYTISLELGFGNSNSLISDSGSNQNGQSTPAVGYEYQYTCRGGLDSSFCDVATLTTTVAPGIQ